MPGTYPRVHEQSHGGETKTIGEEDEEEEEGGEEELDILASMSGWASGETRSLPDVLLHTRKGTVS